MTTSLATHTDTIARALSPHLRIRSAVIAGDLARAEDLLFHRMLNAMEDPAEDIAEAVDAIFETTFGPLLNRALHDAAHREIEAMAHA